MNNLKIIKWILSLQEKDRAIALVMVACSVLWIQNQMDKRQYNHLQDKSKLELIERIDSCDAQKNRLIQIQDNKIIKFQILVDSLAKENLLIMRSFSSNVKVVKK